MAGLDERIVFVVGIHRSGTNWVAGLLSSHPDAVRVTPELFGWSIKVRTFETSVCVDPYSEAIVRDMFAGLPKDKLLVEKSVPHMFHLPALKRIFPGCKIINVRRDPVDVVWSMMHSDWPRGLFPMKFREALDYFMEYYRAERRFNGFTQTIWFENLVRRPRLETGGLLVHVGLERTPFLVRACVAAARHGGAYPERLRGYYRVGEVGAGRRGFSDAEIELICDTYQNWERK